MLKDSYHEHDKMIKMTEWLKAENREFYLVMQEDGNLCLYPN